jgi:hypothetical protein
VTPVGEGEASGPRFPHGMPNAVTAYASSTSIDVAAYEDLPGHHRLAVRNLIAVQQAERSASRIRHQSSARDDGGAPGQEAFVQADGVAGRPAN